MKKEIILTLIVASVLFISRCEFDNYDPPKSFLNGTIVYNNNPVGVRSNGPQLELWQNTWNTRGVIARSKIPVYIQQDGTFSALLFDGNYKLVRLSGAPWENQTDSIDVTVKGQTTVDVPVTPYFTILGETFTYNSADSTISSSCLVTKVGTKTISSLTLYVNTTILLDANVNLLNNVLALTGISDLSIPKTNKVKLSNAAFTSLNGRNYIYARLGVATSGVGERLYTAQKMIMLQ